MTATAYDRLLGRLRDHGSRVVSQGTDKATAQCPAHDDSNPSLSVIRVNGRALAHCHRDCHIDDVLAALGLTKRDLFDDQHGATYTYPDGAKVHRRYDADGRKRFSQSGHDTNGAPTTLYRAFDVAIAVQAGEPVYMVEGEDDVHAVESLNGVATSARQGASSLHKADLTPLYGANVIAIVDKDEAGDKWAAQLADMLNGKASVTFVQAKTGKDAADHIAADHGLDELEPYTFPDPEPDGSILGIGSPIDWHELWADEKPDEEWLVEPLIAARRLVSIYSAPKVGKSLLMLELAAGIATGRGALGQPPSASIQVLYIDFENDPHDDIRPRLTDMGYGPDDLAQLRYHSFPTLSFLDSPRGGLELLALTRHHEARLVVIDTVSRAVAGEENSNDTWLQFYRHTGLLLKREGVACIRLDHTGKDTTKGQRGGSAMSGDVDAVWHLKDLSADLFSLHCEATRQRLPADTLTLSRRLNPLRHELTGPGTPATAAADQLSKCMEWLDALGLPAETGRDACRASLKVAGYSVSTDILAEAVRRRKPVRGQSGQVTQEQLSEDSADSSRTGGQNDPT